MEGVYPPFPPLLADPHSLLGNHPCPCPAYAARVLAGVVIGISHPCRPPWLAQQREQDAMEATGAPPQGFYGDLTETCSSKKAFSYK